MFISASNKVPKNKFHNSFLCKSFLFIFWRDQFITLFVCFFIAPVVNRLVISALTKSTENDWAQVAEKNKI